MDRKRILMLLCLAATAIACGKGPAGEDSPALAAKEIRVATTTGDLPATDPFSKQWTDAREVMVPMLVQDVAEPRLTEKGTETVSVRALRDGENIVFRLVWDDDGVDDLADTDRSVDGAAIQFPAIGEAEGLPDAMMGEKGKPVSISLWRASWQRRADGGTHGIEALYPNAAIDHYPADAVKDKEGRERLGKLYEPPRAVGNPVAKETITTPVEDLTAEGFGTLRPDEAGASVGRGEHRDGKWYVVISRRLDIAPGAKTLIRPGQSTYVAIAVWNGSRDHRGSKKMRSVWIPLVIGEVSP